MLLTFEWRMLLQAAILETINIHASPDFGGIDLDILSVSSYGLALLVSLQWLPHVVRIAPVVVVILDSPVNRVAAVQMQSA